MKLLVMKLKMTVSGTAGGAPSPPLGVCLCFLLYCLLLANPVTEGYTLKNCRIAFSPNVTINMSVLCRGRKLKAVPEDTPAAVVFLDISRNNISEIQKGDFKDLSTLKVLTLLHNNISRVEDGAFADMKALDELNLARNTLSSLSDLIFQGLAKMSKLILYNNRIKTIGSSTFRFLSSLKVLDLSDNRLDCIKTVQHILQHIPNLKELYIMENHFTSFQSQEISNTSLRLKALDLSKNPLKIFRITADIFPKLNTLRLSHCGYQKDGMVWDVQNRSYLSKLSSLDLSGVNMSLDRTKKVLQSVNSSISTLTLYNLGKDRIKAVVNIACSMPTLISLQLRGNNINVVSEELLQFCTLVTEVNLSNNNISQLSEFAFRSMQQLGSLSCTHGILSSVPKAARNLPTLEFLDLSFNRIEKLGYADFSNLTRLKELRLFNNSIGNLEGCVFQGLRDLRTLNLGHNHIQALGDAFKSSLGNLQNLSLYYNQLVCIKKGDFSSLQSLKYLTLELNPIKKLEPGAFEGLANLMSLILLNNNLVHDQIRANVFSVLKNLTNLNLVGNHIKYLSDEPIDPPPFSNLSSLENLLIFGQHHRLGSYLPSNFLEGLTHLLVFEARDFHITSLKLDTFIHTPQLRNLEFTANAFKDLSPEVFHPIPKLERLFLAKTGFKSLDFLIEANLTQLILLQVTHNELSVISDTVLRSLPALTYLDVVGNPFACDCSNAWFIHWVVHNNQTQVVNGYDFSCNYPVDQRDTKLLDLDQLLFNSCSVDFEFFCYISTTMGVLLTLLGSFAYHFLRWQVVYAYHLLLAYLYDTKLRNRRQPDQYDAFVSYNIHDEPWVVDELLPQLEGEQGWRLCLHHRDFTPGKPIIDNITEAIYGSRKTICVISRHYLESEWCSREIQMASFRLFDEQKDVLILVFLEEIPAPQLHPYHRMRRLLKRRSYLSWPRAGEYTRLFWEKLRQTLETGDRPAEENPLLPGVEGP